MRSCQIVDLLTKSIACLSKATAISKSATRGYEDICKAFSQRAEVISAVIRLMLTMQDTMHDMLTMQDTMHT